MQKTLISTNKVKIDNNKRFHLNGYIEVQVWYFRTPEGKAIRIKKLKINLGYFQALLPQRRAVGFGVDVQQIKLDLNMSSVF